jgi:hypothetical protein
MFTTDVLEVHFIVFLSTESEFKLFLYVGGTLNISSHIEGVLDSWSVGMADFEH